MIHCVIHPEVVGEIADAVEWYQTIDPELGCRINAEIYQTIEFARDAPLHYRTIYKNYRRVLCRNFPYKVVFEILESQQSIHIVAVMHQSRDPEVWKKRIELEK